MESSNHCCSPFSTQSLWQMEQTCAKDYQNDHRSTTGMRAKSVVHTPTYSTNHIITFADDVTVVAQWQGQIQERAEPTGPGMVAARPHAGRPYSAYIVSTASRIIGASLASKTDIFTTRLTRRAISIARDSFHLTHSYCSFLPSGRRYQSLQTCTSISSVHQQHFYSFFVPC